MLTRSLLLIAVAVAAGACAKKTPTAANTPAPAASSDGSAPAGRKVEQTADGGLLFQRVHFALNRADLSPQAAGTLATDAKALLANPKLRLRVEGHADERGGTQYNLALSLRRAETIRRYLADLGVEPARIEIVAFGEERPLVVGTGEDAWSKNRRGEMVVTGAPR